ncbi:hypothetical protein PSACC_00385 [Paramicrosporidium saccamoebae]|uniref:Autophagy-related protein 13 n=1 Tax=Paramicrosporidium saccamoebae TaxID=1246581 RepID=A0A2H9TPW2_9FUNG|nr:hypothetical protein PSACC_00385 [Paramicrosporidium saccamoebae]
MLADPTLTFDNRSSGDLKDKYASCNPHFHRYRNIQKKLLATESAFRVTSVERQPSHREKALLAVGTSEGPTVTDIMTKNDQISCSFAPNGIESEVILIEKLPDEALAALEQYKETLVEKLALAARAIDHIQHRLQEKPTEPIPAPPEIRQPSPEKPLPVQLVNQTYDTQMMDDASRLVRIQTRIAVCSCEDLNNNAPSRSGGPGTVQSSAMERVPKKLRPFLDGTQKYKYRLGALLAFLESSNESEQHKVYKDLADQLVTFVVETYNLTLERLNVDKEFYAKFERSLNRDVDEHFKVPLLLTRVLKFLRHEVATMAQCDQLCNIIRVLLHPGNHPALRREGLQLLMLWLRDESCVVPEAVTLFESCVPLSLFVPEGEMIMLDQRPFPLAPDNEPPLFPAPAMVTPKEQALTLFTEILNFMTFDTDADRSSTGFLYGLFREYYLTPLYPNVCKRVGLTEKTTGFVNGCPHALQAILMRYFAMWTIQSPDLFERNSSGTFIPVATFILQEMLLSSTQDLELIHEIIGQSLLLPYSYKPVIKIAVGVLRTWVFNSRERRPAFLQAMATNKVTANLMEKVGIEADGVLDYYLQLYMGLLSRLYDGRSTQGQSTEQIELYREGVYFLRGLAMKVFFTLSRESWDCLLTTLMNLMEFQLTQQNKYAIVSNPDSAEEFSQLLAETLYGTWIRSETVLQAHWERFAIVLNKCTRWSLVVEEWTKTVMTVTGMMSEIVFSVDKKTLEDLSVKRKQIRNGTFEGSQLLSLLNMNNPIGRAMSAELANPAHGKAMQTHTSADHFLSWTESAWAKENIVFLWRNMLRALGDINAIERPEIHEIAIRCIVQVFEQLLAIRETQAYICRPLPPIYESAITLLDACDLPAKMYERSRCLAYSAICRMFCRLPDMCFPDEFYVRFYLAIVNGLSDKDDAVATVIMLCASHVLGRQLPGSTILIPAFLKCIAGMLNSQIPLDRSGVLVPMMRTVSAIAILPDVYPKLTVPRIEAPLPIMSAIPITCAGEMDLDGIKMQVKDLLFMLDLQEYTRNDPPTHSILLSVVNVLLINELLAQTTPSETLVDGYLNVLLDHLLPKDAAVLPIIFDQFLALAQLAPLFQGKFGIEREVLIVQRLVTSIRSAFSDVDAPAGEQDELISKLIVTLLEWLMVLPHDWLTKHHSLREQVFAVLEESLRKATLTAMSRSQSVMGIRSGAVSPSPRKSLDRLPPPPSRDDSTSEDEEEPCLAKEAAEFALVHLMHHLKNFSPEYGPTMVNSQISEPAWHQPGEDRILYFSLADSAILALQQIGGADLDGKPQMRITIRNAAGRFTWNSHSFIETFDHRTSSLFPADAPEKWQDVGRARDFDWISGRVSDTIERFNPLKSLREFTRSPKMMPIYEEGNVELEKTDMLKELLDYIGEEHPGCINKERTSLSLPNPVPEAQREAVQRVEEYCKEQIEAERQVAQQYAKAAGHEAILPSQPSTKAIPPFHYCRQFLAHFGFLSPLENADSPLPIHVLTKTTGLGRDLKGLDMKHARKVVKVAVVYIGPGQEDEQTILQNTPEMCSDAYNELLRSLGWRVDLATHPGYTGGLELGMTIDNKALYHCNSTTEVVFHEAPTLVSTDDSDSKMISKKRHIGNDHVHIIWNEHYRDYRPSFRGDYANVNLVVTPGAGHLYRISIFRESSIPPFGPLFDGALVPRPLLGPLLRATAINAHRAVLTLLGRSMRHPMSHRARDLALIVERHAQQKWSLEQVLSYCMFGNMVLPEEMPKERPVEAARSTIKSPKLDNGFHLESVGPLISGASATLLVVLESPEGMLVESPSSGTMVEIAARSVLLESWSLGMESGEETVSLAEFSRDAMQLVRTVYSLTRLLPAHRLHSATRPVPLAKPTPGLSMCVLENGTGLDGKCVGLEESILGEGTFESTARVTLPSLRSPHGRITINVTYRKHCRFEMAPPTSTTSVRPGSFENVDLTPVLGKTPTNMVSDENAFRFGTSLGSSKTSLRSKSMQKLNSPLGTVQEDSDLTKFIASCEDYKLEPIPITLPSMTELRERLEKVQLWMKEELRVNKSRLAFSPVLEESHDDKNPIMFDMSNIE